MAAAGIAAAPATVQHAEDRRNQNQRCNGCKNEATDDRAPERGVLLAPFAQTERHRHHPDDHGERSHHDRAETDEPGFQRGRGRHH